MAFDADLPRKRYHWPDEANERLRQLWMKGRSLKEIAAQMTDEFDHFFSVSMIGVRREVLGLPPRKVFARATPPKAKHKPIIPLEGEGGVSLIDLTSSQCRWPYADSTFCGAQKARGAYCAHHAERAFRAKQDEAAEAANG